MTIVVSSRKSSRNKMTFSLVFLISMYQIEIFLILKHDPFGIESFVQR